MPQEEKHKSYYILYPSSWAILFPWVVMGVILKVVGVEVLMGVVFCAVILLVSEPPWHPTKSIKLKGISLNNIVEKVFE